MNPDTAEVEFCHANDITPFVPLLERAGLTILSAEDGFVECPGRDTHTTLTDESHCLLYPNNGMFYLHCFHQSCAEERHRVSALLRALGRGTPLIAPVNADELAARHERKRARQEAEAELLRRVLSEFTWTVPDIESDQRGHVEEPLEEQWMHPIALFDDDDVVWIGRSVKDTGQMWHRRQFRTSAEWLHRGVCPGSFICPNSFKPGVYSRSANHVANRRFLIVESDDLKHSEVGAVFRFLESQMKMRLRAVVDTGGKSLHGWFDYPEAATVAKIPNLLRVLKCDLKMLGASQPCRLPGSIREKTGRPQRLIYFPLA